MTTTDDLAPEATFVRCRQIATECVRDGLAGHKSDFELGALQGSYRRLWNEHQRLRRAAARGKRLASSDVEV
jgi:predicted metal-dependent hydrolase